MTKEVKLFDIKAQNKKRDLPLPLSALLRGTHWNQNIGTPVTIKYTFDDAFYYDHQDLYQQLQYTTDISELSTYWLANAAMTQWSNVANIQFTLDNSNPQLGFFNATLSDPQGSLIAGREFFLFDDSIIQRSTVFINKNPLIFAQGEESFAYRHELGHTLGLEHPFAGTSPFPGADNTDVSIMSYTAGMHTSSRNPLYPNLRIYPTTAAIYDIQAAQYLYGPNTFYMSGDTTYSIQPSGEITITDDILGTSTLEGPVVTLWDAGGTDTIDTTLITDPVVVDLREGIDPVTLTAKPSPYATKAKDTVVFLAMPAHIENAKGANIENARTGSGNDVLYGNHLPNRLEGGLGDDSYYDSPESDTYVDIGGSNSYYFQHSLFGNDTITDPGTLRLFIDGSELTGFALRPKGEFTRHATVHTNGHIYEIEYIAKNLVIRPAGEERTITLLNFLPDQINIGLGELPYGRSIRVSQDEGTWDSYFQTRTSCKTQGPYNIHIPTDGSGVFRGSYDSDIIIAGKGADDRALSTYIYGCGGSDRLYANDNNHTLSAVA